jgi:excisionase family DNA binding protein
MELITQSEAARRLKVSRQRVGRLVDSGRLPFVPVAGRRFISPAALKRLKFLPVGNPMFGKSKNIS